MPQTASMDIMQIMQMDLFESRIRRKEERERREEEREERRANQQMLMHLFMMQMGGSMFKPKTPRRCRSHGEKDKSKSKRVVTKEVAKCRNKNKH